MGDLVGNAVAGTLFLAPRAEFDRAREASRDVALTTALFADLCRLNVLYMIARAGSGHIGSSFSSLDFLSYLLLHRLRAGTDVLFSSKGHDAPATYAALLGLGRLPFDLIHKLRRAGGLPGHPDVATPGIATNTGSLGMGISKAKGMAEAARRAGRDARFYVVTGDGELQEGQIWESLVTAAHGRRSELTAIVDHNKLQSDTLVALTSDLGDLAAKFRAFGWHVERVDGHDVGAFAAAVARCHAVEDRPQAIIAHTIKGKGVSFMESTSFDSDVELYRFHSGAPDEANYRRAATELIDRINKRFRALGQPELAVETVQRAAAPAAPPREKLLPAYSAALIEAAGADPRLMALDADLALDTGLIPFRERFPDRLIECGIAEMDMVSQAGGLALAGLRPVVHSFAAFLTARANEQIYNNATERTRIVYVGSLAGVLPGGPGHSHQAVRDIAALGGVPGLVMVEPSAASEVAPLLRWCLEAHDGSAYLRLVSIPVETAFTIDATAKVEVGKGTMLADGDAAMLVAYGPVLLAEAMKAVRLLAAEGMKLRLFALPWLNRIDADWLADAVRGTRHLFALDNHSIDGGQGQMLAAAVAERGLPVLVHRLGVEGVPAFGSNDEVLAAHRLDGASIAARVRQALGARK